MGKTEALIVVFSEQQSGGIENRLGEDEAFEGRTVSQHNGTAPGERLVPDLDHLGRVSVAKRAILHLCAPLSLSSPRVHPCRGSLHNFTLKL